MIGGRLALCWRLSRTMCPAWKSRPCCSISLFRLCSSNWLRSLSTVNCVQSDWVSPVAEFDWDYLCSSDNISTIKTNISNRKGIGDLDRVISLWNQLHCLKQQGKQTSVEYNQIESELHYAAADIPNKTHPQTPIGDESCAQQMMLCGQKSEFSFAPKSAVEIGESLDILRTQHVGHSSGPRTYYFKNELAHLEEALVQFTLDTLVQKYNFKLVSVPNLVRPEIIEGCGFKTSGERTQVYRLNRQLHGDLCLAGTGEFPLAGYYLNRCLLLQDLPQRVTTVSHCYRAETSDIARESGLYRVHQFTKVEMFAVTACERNGAESDEMLEDFVHIEKYLFEQLGLHFRVLDMPTLELGAPAYRKIDMEAWLPAKQFWGEISSTSNCTDFQSRRLGIKYVNKDGIARHCHTVNGTACAVPRMIIAILENYQQSDGTVLIPTVLHRYMDNKTHLSKPVASISHVISRRKS